MVQVWKVIRVFISSTFRDMGAERDHLVRFVFPELRERCARRRLHLVDVDLRWGVTEEEAETGKVLEICLDEIERCRPYFIGILGERFGHIPSNYDVPAGVAYDWLRKIQPGHSITALEIYHGVLQNPEMAAHAFFYFRDPTFIDDVPVTARGPFLSEGEESARKLVILKDSIRGRFPVFDNYPCSFQGLSATGNALLGDLDQFGKHVLEDLWTAISQEHSLDSVTPDELAVERAAHESFIENRTQHFVGRTGLLEALTRFADTDEGRILAVVGAAGIGKSALISTFVRQYAASHPDVFVLPHFFGINPSATEIRTMLRRICRELATHYGTNTEISEDYNHVRKTFAELLEETGKNGKTLLLLDALDQLEPDHGARLLNWLPHLLPDNVRVIVTTLEGACLDALRRRQPRPKELEIAPLPDDEGAEIVRQTLWQYRKRLDENADNSQMAALLAKREADSPLYLAVACEELRVFGEFTQITSRIAHLPDTTSELFEQVFDRLENDHGRDLVKRTLSMLECSRHGLLETELLDLLGNSASQPLPRAVWSWLRRNLAAYLRAGTDDDGLLSFFHRQLSAAVRLRYLPRHDDAMLTHARLAEYFRAKGDPAGDDTWDANYPRALSEFPFHVEHAELPGVLKSVLTNLPFIDAKCRAGMVYGLMRDYQSASQLVQSGELEAWAGFIARQSPLLLRFPTIAIQQAINQPDNTPIARAAQVILGRRDPTTTVGQSCLHWLNKPQQPGPEAAMLRTLYGHSGWVEAVAVTPDGRFIVSVSHRWIGDKREDIRIQPEMKVWDFASGEAVSTLEGMTAIAISPDARFVAASAGEGEIGVWMLPAGPEQKRLKGHRQGVTALAMTPDGRYLISGSYDKTIKVWDLESGACVQEFTGHVDQITALRVTPDGRWLVSRSFDKAFYVWNLETRQYQTRLRVGSFEHNTMATTPDSNHVVVDARADWDLGTPLQLRYFELTTGRDVGGHSLPHAAAHAIIVSADAEHIICASGDPDEIRVLQRRSNSMWVLRGHADTVVSLALTPDGSRLVSGSWDSTVRIWDWRTPTSIDIHSRPQDKAIKAMVLTKDRRRAVSVSEALDSNFAVWDSSKATMISSTRCGAYETAAVAVSPDQNRVLVGGLAKLKVRDIDTGRTIARLFGHRGVWSVCISPDAALAAGGRGSLRDTNFIRLWNFSPWRRANPAWWARLLRVPVNLLLMRNLPTATLYGHRKGVSALSFLPDGRKLISGSWDEELRIWDVKQRRCDGVLKGHTSHVTSIAVSADGSFAVSASADATARIWDLHSLRQIRVLQHPASLSACALTPDGTKILTAGADYALRLWETGTGNLHAVFPTAGQLATCAATSNRGVICADKFANIYVLRLGSDDVPDSDESNPPPAPNIDDSAIRDHLAPMIALPIKG